VQVSSVTDCASPLPGDAGHLTAVSRNSFKQIQVIEHSDMRSINALPCAALTCAALRHAAHEIVGIVMPLH